MIHTYLNYITIPIFQMVKVLFHYFLYFFQETTPNVINWQDYEGRSALHLAVADGNEAVVNALVSTRLVT